MHPTVGMGLFLVMLNYENSHRLSTTVTEYYVFQTVSHNSYVSGGLHLVPKMFVAYFYFNILVYFMV